MANNSLKGCGYLVAATSSAAVFTPEDFSDEQKQIGETTEIFIKNEVLPNLEEIEKQNFDLVVELIRKSGELGLLMVDAPEAYGGLELDKATSMLVAEKLAPAGSFAVSHMAHTGIGTLPLVYYGTDDQKGRYLGRLMSGEWIASYCLTEPGSGSDALGAQTSAILSEDGTHYILNGTKQFITNGGFADFFTVFAKVDRQHFTGFLIERTFDGVSFGAEEKKMGIKGSSTVQVILDNARVPVENVLGEVGKAHKIAFNVLNVGRIKLGALSVGVIKHALGEAARYANQRKQFNVPISGFGAIKEKLANITAETYASEAVIYRLAGLIDGRLANLDKGRVDYYAEYQKGIEEYAAECAIVKVFCSEVTADGLDEALQIHGGYGFISEYSIERFYRDERVQRIYEGTNEINRILIPTIYLRKGIKAEAAVAVVDGGDGDLFVAEKALLRGLKDVYQALLGVAVPRLKDMLLQEQEILMALADVVIQIFALESAVLRAEKNFRKASAARKELLLAVVKVFTFSARGKSLSAAQRAAIYLEEGVSAGSLLGNIERLARYDASGLLPAKRLLAEATSEMEKYIF